MHPSMFQLVNNLTNSLQKFQKDLLFDIIIRLILENKLKTLTHARTNTGGRSCESPT